MLKTIPIALIAAAMLLGASFEALAAACSSVATGDWSSAGSWNCGRVPLATDDVTIIAGHTITMSGNSGAANSLVINGTAYWAQSRTTNVGTGRVTINAGGNITGTSNGVLTSAGGLTLNATLTSANVTIVLQTNAGRTITGSGSLANLTVDATATNSGNLTVRASLAGSSTLTNTGTLTIGGNATISALNAGTAGNTVIYSGNSAQTIKAAVANTYHHLTLSGSGAKAAPTMLIVMGNFTNNGTFGPASGSTVSFAGSAAQSISGNTLFGSLTFANTGGTVSAGAFVHNVQGHFTDNGSFAPGTSEIVFSGPSGNQDPQQTITGTATVTAFNKLTVNGAKGLAMLHNATVNTLLTCTSGIITTGIYTLGISATGSISGASVSSYVNGKLKKTFTVAASFTFTVGDANNNYTPVAVNFTSMTQAGSLTASTTAGDHPDISITSIDGAMSVNRYWTLSSTDITGVYDVTLNFLAADVDNGADTSIFIIQRLDQQTQIWNNVTLVAANPTSTSGTGIITAAAVPPATFATGFGDFAVGQSGITDFIREKELIYMQELYN